MPIHSKTRQRFVAKVAAGFALIVLGDQLFYGYGGGGVIGVFAMAWLGALVGACTAVRRARGGRIAIATAAGFAFVLIDDPSLIATILFLSAIGTAALLPRHIFDHAGRWLMRLIALALLGPFRAPGDMRRLASVPVRGHSNGKIWLLNLALPLGGGAAFLALFANANPVLGNALGAIRVPSLTTLVLHALLWVFLLSLAWPTLRPRALNMAVGDGSVRDARPDLPVRTLVLTLFIFNAVFALENALDIVFLWSGATLPAGVTLAEYAHRGAYTLIVTALLAGLFVLVALRPGTAAARDILVRRLVLAWVAQNVLLVASSILRLIDYIEAYSLTVLRISALLWMGLVAVGLMLICWRFLTARSAAWLINANALAASLVLALVSIVDLGAVAASWNVHHLRDTNRIDLCYLRGLGSSALLPLIALRDKATTAEMRDNAVYVSQEAYGALQAEQADWQSWNWRGARRLARAEALLADDEHAAITAPNGRDCDGNLLRPEPIAIPIAPAAALTPETKP